MNNKTLTALKDTYNLKISGFENIDKIIGLHNTGYKKQGKEMWKIQSENIQSLQDFIKEFNLTGAKGITLNQIKNKYESGILVKYEI